MPQAIIIFAQTALATVGYTAAALVGGSIAYSTALYIGAAVIVGGSVVAKKAMSLFEMEMPQVDSDVSRQSTAKTTVAPQKIIYGEALVSGPISYIALAGANNADLYQTIVLAGHEVNAITDIHFDDEIITNAQIAAGLNNGSNTAGDVTGGTFGPIDSNTICVINKHLGAASQASDPMLTNKFALYTSDHRGEGIAYLAMKWTLDEDSAEVWEKYSPGNVKALVQGKQVYDPRLEVTAGGTAGASPTNAAYVAYSTNPALCVTDYLIDQTLGMGIAAAKIDWAAVITAANGCDVDVDVPNNATQKRFTANGVLFGTDSHQKNINKLLSAMNGRLIYSNGKYIVKAGIYEEATEDLTEDDLIGAIQIKTSLERSDRFNTIRGIFVDAAANNKSTEFPKVQLLDAVTRDNGEVLEKEIQLPMVSDSYQAQRIANKLIQLSDQQKIISFPANLSALRITAGDRVRVTVEELSWNQKVFECIGWTFSDEGGVNLTLREDSSLSYGDPLPAAYSQITSDGSISDGFRGVPSPSGLTATAGLKNIELSWVNPGKPSDFGTVYVYASKNANFSSAIKIGETDGTQFVHDASNKTLLFSAGLFNIGDSYTIRDVGNTNWVAIGATAPISAGVVFTATGAGSGTGKAWETIVPGNLRYYWVRAVKNIGTDDASRSGLEPPNDPNTTVFATVGAVEWVDVANPTIGIDINNSDEISINLGVANTTTGQTVATSGLEAGTTVTQGGITMNQGGSIKGGQSAYNSGTGFFLGYDTNAYKFSIGNSSTEALTFDGTNLAVTGTVNASAGAFTGDVSTDSKFIAGSGAASATMDGGDPDYRIYAGGLSPALSPFKVDSSGTVTATRLVVTRPNDLSAVIFDSARDGLVGIGLASLSQDTGAIVAGPAVELTSQTNTVSVILTNSQTLTLEAILALPAAKKYAGNYTTAKYPASITATIQYSTNSGSSWSTFGTAVALTRTAATSPSDASKFGVLTAAVDGNGRTGYRRDVHAIDDINNIHFIESAAFAPGSYLFRVQLSFVAGSSPDTDYEPDITGNRTLQFGTDGDGFSVNSSGVITDQSANYLPLSGGTLTGALSGTSGTFTGAISGASFELSGISVIDSSQNINAASISTDAITSAGDITLTSTTTSSPSVNFNSSTATDPAVDMAIKLVGEELHFYEPEDTNKVHFKIYDDTGVDAPFGYWVNGTRMADASRNLTVGTISSGAITASGDINIASTVSELRINRSGIRTRKIVLYDSALGNDFQFYGFGVESASFINSVYTTSDTFYWYAGVNSTTRQLAGSLSGTGDATFAGTISSGAITSSGVVTATGGALTGNLDIKKTGADTIVDIRGNSSYDPVLNLRSDQGPITSEGFQIWYDNNVGDAHIATTYADDIAAIRFHTRTGADKSETNERFAILGNGLVNIVSGNLAMGGSAVITNDRSLFPTSIEVSGSYSGGSGDYTNITNAQLKIGSAGSADFWRIPHFSTHASVSGVYNYQTGKDVYWGEPADTGNYYFRGRDLVIEDGVLKIGTATVIDASNNLTTVAGTFSGNVILGGTAASTPYNNAGTKLTFGGGSDFANYSIGTSMEDVGGNYSKLDLRWHTGIRMGAQGVYGGIRFYNNEDFTTKLMSIGEGSAVTDVKVYNDLITGGSIFPPAMGIGLNAYPASIGHTAASNEGIFWHVNADYGIYRTAGTWVHPTYQQLRISFDTGIELDGGTAYGKSGVNLIAGNFKVGGLVTIDASRNISGNTLTAGDAFRSDRSEDASGTFLFRKGATTGVTRHLNLADTETDPAAVTDAQNPSGISWGQRTDNNGYYLIGLKGAYNNGYGTHSRLRLGWHTGIEIGANPTYGGTRFFSDSPFISTTEIMSIGKSDSNVRITNNLYVTGTISASGGTSTNWNSAYTYSTVGHLPLAGGTLTGTLNVTSGSAYFVGVDIGSASQTTYSLLRLNSNNGNFQAWKAGTGYTSWGGASAMNIYTSAGNLCFHPAGEENVVKMTPTGIECSKILKANAGLSQDGHTLINGSDTWYRTSGNEGIYFSSHAGGVHMTDTTWVRTYNNKRLYVGGGSAEIATSGNVTAYYSDMRLKTKTADIDNALEKVNSLSGFKYVENDLAKELGYSNDKQQVGLSAQQIQAVLPEAVSLAPIDMDTDEQTGEITSKSGENYLTVDYAKLVPLLVEAIKELTQEVETLKTKLKEK